MLVAQGSSSVTVGEMNQKNWEWQIGALEIHHNKESESQSEGVMWSLGLELVKFVQWNATHFPVEMNN